jgi:hypothetical protein
MGQQNHHRFSSAASAAISLNKRDPLKAFLDIRERSSEKVMTLA